MSEIKSNANRSPVRGSDAVAVVYEREKSNRATSEKKKPKPSSLVLVVAHTHTQIHKKERIYMVGRPRGLQLPPKFQENY